MIASLVTRGDVDLEPILQTLDRQPKTYPSRIHVWDNSHSINLQVLGRYAIQDGDGCWVCTQDDDCLVDWDELFKLYAGNRDTILCNLPATHRPNYINTPEKLVGFGAIFPWSLIAPTFALYLKHYPFDNVLLREADRIFTGLNHERIILADVPVTHLPHATDADRMYRHPDHEAYRVEARRRVLGILEAEGRAWVSR